MFVWNCSPRGRSVELQVPSAGTSRPVLRGEEGTEKQIVSMLYPS